MIPKLRRVSLRVPDQSALDGKVASLEVASVGVVQVVSQDTFVGGGCFGADMQIAPS